MSRIEQRKAEISAPGISPDNENNCLPGFSLNTAKYNRQDQLDVWQDYTMPLFEVSPLRCCGFTAAVEGWKTSNLVFANYCMDAQRWYRKKILIGSDKTEYVILRYYRTGGLSGMLDGESISMSTGEIHLFDLSSEMQCSTDACDQISVFIPYSEIGYDPSLYPSLITIPSGTPVGRILLSMMINIMGLLPGATLAEANDLSTALTGTLRGILSGRRANDNARSHFERARDRAMRAYIRDNLSDPDMGLNTLSRNFGASKATISRIFACSGGVGQYIAQQRLERAYRELSQRPVGRGDIQDLALRFGYLDPNSFTRAFRKRFGVAPSEVANGPNQFAGSCGNHRRADCCMGENPESRRLVKLLGICE